MPDSDDGAAVTGVIVGMRFTRQGKSCTAGSRLSYLPGRQPGGDRGRDPMLVEAYQRLDRDEPYHDLGADWLSPGSAPATSRPDSWCCEEAT